MNENLEKVINFIDFHDCKILELKQYYCDDELNFSLKLYTFNGQSYMIIYSDIIEYNLVLSNKGQFHPEINISLFNIAEDIYTHEINFHGEGFFHVICNKIDIEEYTLK